MTGVWIPTVPTGVWVVYSDFGLNGCDVLAVLDFEPTQAEIDEISKDIHGTGYGGTFVAFHEVESRHA